MDDHYLINAAKTEFREAYNTGDVERLMGVYDQDGFTDLAHGDYSAYHPDALARVRERAAALFREYSIHCAVGATVISVQGDRAYDFGWHEFTMRPQKGGETVHKRERYFELWTRKSSNSWKISLFISNEDVKEHLGGLESRWFISENLPAV